VITMPRAIQMSAYIGEESRGKQEWLRSPASLAEHLSRGLWRRAKHLDYISNKIIECEHRPLRLIVTMPPRHGKSELISHWTPVWFLKRWPWKRVIITSYQSGYATEWGGLAKNSMVDNAHELGLELMQDTKAKARWQIKGYGGGMTAAGIGGPITGRGGDLIIIDDPIKSQKEALSETYRNSTWEWYRATLRTRAQPGASIILLMTRWHEDDLAGRLIASSEIGEGFGDKWEVINLPALAEENDPLGRKPGEALWPEQYDVDTLLDIKESLGSFWWNAEYQGHPITEGGGIIKEAWFGYFDDDPFTRDKDKVRTCIQVWDTAYEQSKVNDRSACITIVETNHYYDVIDVWAGRPTFPELCKSLKHRFDLYLPDRIYVEAKASGKSLVQQIRADTKLPVLEINDNDDKSARLHSVSGIVEAGKVRLKARAPWLQEFLHEVCGFPSVQFDDITDVFSHALRKLRPQIGGKQSIIRRGKKRPIWAGQINA